MRHSRYLLLALCTVLAATMTAHADDTLHERPRYQIQPGDVVELHYRFTPEFNQTITVQPDGHAELNVIGDVKLSDLTVDQARDTIVARAKETLNNPDLNVVLKDFQHPYVVVAGEVNSPGKIELREHTSAVQAVMLAGGFKQDAKTKRILVFRRINNDTAEVKQLDLHHLSKTSDMEKDFQLSPGDMLLVQRDNLEKVSRYVKVLNLGMYFDPLAF